MCVCVCVCVSAPSRLLNCFVYTAVYSIFGTSANKTPSICVSAMKGQYKMVMIGFKTAGSSFNRDVGYKARESELTTFTVHAHGVLLAYVAKHKPAFLVLLSKLMCNTVYVNIVTWFLHGLVGTVALLDF